MNNPMCVHGYGANFAAIWPYIDTDKLGAMILKLLGCYVDTTLGTDESIIEHINRIDCDLANQTPGFSLSDVLDHLDPSPMTELVADNRAEWFFYLPACMLWESGFNMPQTQDAADSLLMVVLRPLLLDGVKDSEITAHFDDLRCIS